ncbi:MAG: HDIG domain-containing protein [Candidatus Aminicenantes bacterium]|nr:MAG: HDIG domain-containing protein [Candidatus Aminicenantes bacterium]
MPFKLNFFKSYQSLSGKSKKKMSIAILFIGFLFVLVTSYLLHIPQQEVITPHSLNVGDIVKEDIKINTDITIEDKGSTEAKRKQVLENLVPIYEYYQENQTKSGNTINQWFHLITEARKTYIKNKKDKKTLIRIKNQIEKEFGLEFSEKEIRSLLRTDFFNKVDLNKLLEFVRALYDKKILRSLTGVRQSKQGTIKVVSKTSEPVILTTNDIYDLNKIKAALIRFINQQGFAAEPVELIASTLKNFIEENISYSMNLTREEEQRAAAAVNPVHIKYKTGKVILREGDEVTPEDMKILNLIAAQTQIRKPQLSDFYLILVILAFLTIFGGKFFKIWVSSGINKNKLFAVTGATLLVSVIIYRVCLFLFPLILQNITLDIHYEAQSIFYAIPFGFGVLVIAFIFNLQSAVIYSFVNSIIGGMICDWDFRIFLYILLGNLVVSYGIEYYQRLKRSPIIKAAVLWLLPANMIMVIFFHLTEAGFNLKLLLVNIVMGIFSALLCPILANFFIPIWEMMFQLVTELKLIELTNLNLPIFREMLEKAPGTYHHSQMVASLSESAAQDLGLSPLVQTAMALYHDIGKIDNPHFFSENHTIYKNPHKNMPPRDSAKNIIAHIPDGVERASKIKLPPLVRSSILQHHGTKLVRFFYDKAKEISTVDSDGLDDKVFRYPGEKPKNIENAIIMLADQVEAASKSLGAPTDEEIKNVIRKIIDADIEENQFDECEGLTIKNLNIIANSFLKKLSSIYHMRVSYPGFDFKEKETIHENGRIQTSTDRHKTIS